MKGRFVKGRRVRTRLRPNTPGGHPEVRTLYSTEVPALITSTSMARYVHGEFGMYIMIYRPQHTRYMIAKEDTLIMYSAKLLDYQSHRMEKPRNREDEPTLLTTHRPKDGCLERRRWYIAGTKDEKTTLLTDRNSSSRSLGLGRTILTQGSAIPSRGT